MSWCESSMALGAWLVDLRSKIVRTGLMTYKKCRLLIFLGSSPKPLQDGISSAAIIAL